MVEDRERYIEEMVATYLRRELDDIASGLGLNPGDYPNKRVIAEAILEAREREEAPVVEAPVMEVAPIAEVPIAEEAPLEYPFEEEVTKEVEEVSPDTVKGKIKAIEEKVAEINTGVQEQVKENEAAVAAFVPKVQEQIQENEAAVAEFMSGVQEQVKENEAAVAAFVPKVQEQIQKNEDFVKQFYG